MSSAVMRDNPIPCFHEDKHLGIPVVAAQRPTMMENQRLTVAGSPVLVENMYTVFGDNVAGVARSAGSYIRFSGCSVRSCRSSGSKRDAASHDLTTTCHEFFLF